MRLIWKVTMLAAVPLLALGQEAKDEDDEDAAPKAGASADGFAPYQTILDRMPFGPLPPNFNPDAPPGTATAGAGASGEEEVQLTEDEQQIVSSVRVSILNVTPSGAVAVGFTDSAAQPPANYYMKVGEKRDVWEVKEADPAEQTVVLVKNGVEATLKVGEGVAAGGDRKAKGAGVRPMQASSRMMMRAGGPETAGNIPPHASAMERLRARRMRSVEDLKAEEARREAAAAEERKNAAQAAAEREQQREALLQIQEELRRQREEREQRAAQEAQAKQQEETAVE